MMNDVNRALSADDGATLKARAQAAINGSISPSSFSDREKLALACRFLADNDHARTLAGQISIRCADGGYWTTSFATGFADASVSTMVRINENMDVIEGDGISNPATRFHLWVYAKRPDVRAIVHTHPPHASALAMSGQPLTVSHMDMMMFHDDLAQLKEWPGVPLANEEGMLISEALGEKHAILLANHGILTAGEGIESAVYLAANLEYAAQLQYLCVSSGQVPQPVKPELASEARRFLTSSKLVQATFDYWCRRTLRRHTDALV